MVLLSYKDEDKVKILFNTVKIIRTIPDSPLIWKLTIEYLDSLCEYMHIMSHDLLLKEKFLDASIDATSKISGCVCKKDFYHLIRY